MAKTIDFRDAKEQNMSLTQLAERIRLKEAKVGIIGLGYVGLPLAVAYAKAGYGVIGYDVDLSKVSSLSNGNSYVIDVPSETVAQLVNGTVLNPTNDPQVLREADAIIICVPTPFSVGRAPDLTYIEAAADTIACILRPGQLIILESTTYPGTTEELVVPILLKSGLTLHEDFEVAFSPERIDPGNSTYHVENTPKVVGGLGKRAGDLAEALYGSVVNQVVRVDSPREAEMAKLIENTFRHINIALVNELAVIANKMGVNIWQAIEAASSKPFGFMPFYPGPGVGGHCIPIDPHYLSWKAKELGMEISFIELAEKINSSMPKHVVDMAADALTKVGKTLKGAKVMVLGVAYKKDIDDLRESPALNVINLLLDADANVCYFDPYVASCRIGNGKMCGVELTADSLAAQDCAILITDHSSLDKDLVVKHSSILIDTRNTFKNYTGDNIVRL